MSHSNPLNIHAHSHNKWSILFAYKS